MNLGDERGDFRRDVAEQTTGDISGAETTSVELLIVLISPRCSIPISNWAVDLISMIRAQVNKLSPRDQPALRATRSNHDGTSRGGRAAMTASACSPLCAIVSRRAAPRAEHRPLPPRTPQASGSRPERSTPPGRPRKRRRGTARPTAPESRRPIAAGRTTRRSPPRFHAAP